MLVETRGSGPRVVLVHGSIGNAQSSWTQQAPLAERFRLVLVTRTGYPPGPPVERIDFEDEAERLADVLEQGDHLVGHSYGGVVSLLAAARRPDALASLTVGEPPAFGVARADPAVQEFVERMHAFFAAGPYSPEDYLRGFIPAVGSTLEGIFPLPPPLEQGTRAAMVERSPWEAEIPLAGLRRADFPKLVVSGAHHRAFDAVCDVLEHELGAERAVLPGAGHSVQRAPGFNNRLERFLASAA